MLACAKQPQQNFIVVLSLSPSLYLPLYLSLRADAEPHGHPDVQPEAGQDERRGVPGHGHVCQFPRQGGNTRSSEWRRARRQDHLPGLSR